MFKVDESAQESILRTHESWWSSETEGLNSPKLSSKFWTCSKLMRLLESRWECMRVGGQTRVTVWTLINFHLNSEHVQSWWTLISCHRNFEHVQSWRERSRVDESARELVVKREWQFELSSTFISILNMFKVDERARELMRVHESWWSNENKSLNSHQLSSKFWTRSKLMRALESRRECMRVGGQTRVKVWTLINCHWNSEHVQSWCGWWECMRADDNSWRSNESESLSSHPLSTDFLACSKLMRALESRWECIRIGGQTRVKVWTLINTRDHRNFEHVQSWWECSRVDSRTTVILFI